ncbi:MAG: S41 family peptidase [bacterium]
MAEENRFHNLQKLTYLLIVVLLIYGGRNLWRNFASPKYKKTKIFLKTFDIIQARYIDKTEPKDLIYSAVDSMVKSLGDPYSQFIPQEVYGEVRMFEKGEYGGLGIVIGIRDNKVIVISPIEGTPADEAGIKPGDVIVKIGGISCVEWSLPEVVKELRGEEGTKVLLHIKRGKHQKLLHFEIVRKIIELKSVYSKLINDSIGYIRIVDFGNGTLKSFQDVITSLDKKETKSLILDLRNNPGGFIDQAVEISDCFLSKGLIVKTKGRSKEQTKTYRATEGKEDIHLPLVVLINKGSASAAEIVAGALQCNKRATIIGTSSFGKGSVQGIFHLPDKTALCLTIARYYIPDGSLIDGKGIHPDIEIKIPDSWYEKSINEQIELLDPQLEKAVEFLKNR